MSNTNLLGSEEWAVVATVDPDANGTGIVLSDAIDMKLFEQILVVAMTGDMGAAATLAVKLQSSPGTASPNVYTDVTNKAITTIDDGSPAGFGQNLQAIINLRGDELTEGHRFVKVSHTIGTATSDTAVLVLGKGKSGPSSDNDLASVTEIVA
jgi:hypothetical protein